MGVSMGVAYSQMRTLRKIAEGITDLLTFKESTGKNYKRDLDRLIRKGYVILGGEKIELSPAGKKLLKESSRNDFEIAIPDSWDGNWHLISYDIPENFKKERNYLRRKFIELGFGNVHKSLWLYPYDCKEEIAIFAQNLGISTYIIYLTTNYIPGQNKYKNKYGLK